MQHFKDRFDPELMKTIGVQATGTKTRAGGARKKKKKKTGTTGTSSAVEDSRGDVEGSQVRDVNGARDEVDGNPEEDEDEYFVVGKKNRA